jgi:Domain of unknown function (DUF5060)
MKYRLYAVVGGIPKVVAPSQLRTGILTIVIWGILFCFMTVSAAGAAEEPELFSHKEVPTATALALSSAAFSARESIHAGDLPCEDKLCASPSGHYFTYRGREVMFVGDSGTQCVMQDLNIDYRAWLDDLSARGINAAHIWAFVAPRQKLDGSVVETRYGYVYPGVTPWKAKVGAADRFRQWDLTQFDEGSDPRNHYWPRLRDLASYAHDKGICLGVTLFFGWPKHDSAERNDWAIHPLNRANGGHLEHNYETVVIEIPGREVLGEAWSDSWCDAKKTQWVWETYAQKMIDELGSYDNVFFVYKDERSYETGAWRDNMTGHMLSFLRRRGAFVLVDWEAEREDVDAVMVATHGVDKNAVAQTAFRRRPARPVVMLESPPYTLGDPSVRVSMWTFAIGGGHFFFHDDERQGNPQTGIMGYDPTTPRVAGCLTKWMPVTLDFRGPRASASDANPNPFLDYRLQVRFTSPSGKTHEVPGFFAADGKAGLAGDVWRSILSPDEVGVWRYAASFRHGKDLAVCLEPHAGDSDSFDGAQGELSIGPPDSSSEGFYQRGRLEYVGSHYLKFRDGGYWIKGGTDSPEDFLAYHGFSNTPKARHRYASHVGDWREGDPDWGDGQGKGIIGALNYLASQEVNSIYFLPMNVGGDGKNVYPWLGPVDGRQPRKRQPPFRPDQVVSVVHRLRTCPAQGGHAPLCTRRGRGGQQTRA